MALGYKDLPDWLERSDVGCTAREELERTEDFPAEYLHFPTD